MHAVATLDEIRLILHPALADSLALRAIVFGSYARGDADRYSDLDLIIVAQTDKKFMRRGEDFEDVQAAWGRAMDMLVYTPEELEQLLREERGFIIKALEEGVTIYEKPETSGGTLACPVPA